MSYAFRNIAYTFRFLVSAFRYMSHIFRYMSYIFRKLPNCRKKLPKSLELISILHKKYCLQQRFVTIARLGLCLNFLRKFIRSFVLVKLSAKFTQLPQAVKRCARCYETAKEETQNQSVISFLFKSLPAGIKISKPKSNNNT